MEQQRPSIPNPHPSLPLELVPLWAGDSPNNGSNPGYRPMIRIYYPAAWPEPDAPRTARGIEQAGDPRAAMLICPGGGYGIQARHEGEPFAQLLAMHGIVGIVLTYRVAPDVHPAPFADAARAMRLIRHLAPDYWIDPDRVGIMGFSAGGHLAATVATQPELHADPEDDLSGAISARPNRAVLGYPVISMAGDAHTGSHANLLGDQGDRTDQEMRRLGELLSADQHVGKDTPPSFLFHTADDDVVPVSHSLRYAAACAAAGVSCETHIYAHGRHGVGMATDDPALRGWTAALIEWLREWTR